MQFTILVIFCNLIIIASKWEDKVSKICFNVSPMSLEGDGIDMHKKKNFISVDPKGEEERNFFLGVGARGKKEVKNILSILLLYFQQNTLH